MSGSAGLIVALNSAGPATLAALRTLPSAVSTINLRADLAGDIDATQIRQQSACQLIYSLRSQAQGGASIDPDSIRHRRLLAAAQHFDIVELEAERDTVPRLLAAIEPARRLVSWHGAGVDAASLARRFAAMARVEAALGCAVSLGAARAPLCRDDRPAAFPECSRPPRRRRLRCGSGRILDPFDRPPTGSAVHLRRDR